MAKFFVGVDIEQVRSTIIVVEVEAETIDEAEKKAINGVHSACLKARKASDLGIGSFHEWDGDGFACLGTNHEENWNSGDWSSDLKV